MFFCSSGVFIDENCADKPVFTPSSLLVKFGESIAASCSVCQRDCLGYLFDLEKPLGHVTKNGTTILWRVDSVTEWDTSPLCFYNNATGDQCCTTLPVTVYQPLGNVSISFLGHTGPMFEGHRYTLQCSVQDVAPVQNLVVTFHRGQTVLGRLESNSTEKKPVTEVFTLNITPSKEDDRVQYWCEAKLELGHDGPQRPPVVISQKITATVYYKPHLEDPSVPITITKGNPLQLNCTAVGNPRPSYTWTLPSQSRSSTNSSVLTINSVTFADGGSYTCSVSNNMGTVDLKLHVNVKDDHKWIIVVIVVVALVLVSLGLTTYAYCYKHNRMGQYNLRDVFRLQARHSAVPTAE